MLTLLLSYTFFEECQAYVSGISWKLIFKNMIYLKDEGKGKKCMGIFFRSRNDRRTQWIFLQRRVLTIVILGSICGLHKTNQIHQWAKSQ